MQIVLLLLGLYIVLAFVRKYVGVPAALGMAAGGMAGFWAGSWLVAQGVKFPFLPLIYAVIVGFMAGSALHGLFRKHFPK
jgi:uncharacterized membrane protein YfcA